MFAYSEYSASFSLIATKSGSANLKKLTKFWHRSVDCWLKFTHLMTNSADPDQLASSESFRWEKIIAELLAIFQQTFGDSQVVWMCCVSYVTGASTSYWSTVGQGLLSL